jgi:hypothetical protein
VTHNQVAVQIGIKEAAPDHGHCRTLRHFKCDIQVYTARRGNCLMCVVSGAKEGGCGDELRRITPEARNVSILASFEVLDWTQRGCVCFFCRVVVLSLHARNPDQHSLKGTEVKFESSSTKGGLDDRCAACGIVSPVKPKAI